MREFYMRAGLLINTYCKVNTKGKFEDSKDYKTLIDFEFARDGKLLAKKLNSLLMSEDCYRKNKIIYDNLAYINMNSNFMISTEDFREKYASTYLMVVLKGNNVKYLFDETITITEAAEILNKDTSTIRKAVERAVKVKKFTLGVECRKAKQTWLLKRSAVLGLFQGV